MIGGLFIAATMAVIIVVVAVAVLLIYRKTKDKSYVGKGRYQYMGDIGITKLPQYKKFIAIVCV